MRQKHLLAGCLLSILLACMGCQQKATTAATQQIKKQTEIFAIQGNDTLRMDRYTATNDYSKQSKKSPVILFAFGGGFKGGDRASTDYTEFFEFFAKQGYTVISTDYRTTLRDFDASQVNQPTDFMNALQTAIQTAVFDLYTATNYVIDHSEEWQIDPQRIILSGSSAGAISVLQAEYQLCQNNTSHSFLPKEFRYAGVVSFAGAIADINSPQWPQSPCPIMLFHGDADPIVPYRAASIPGQGGLWGSAEIAESLEAAKAPYTFYRISNAGHEVSSTPMHTQLFDILSFLDRQVMHNEPLVIQASSKLPNDTLQEHSFTIEDYLKSNL